jgi:hypothetical protein
MILAWGVLLTASAVIAQTATQEHKMYLLGPKNTLTELSLQTGTVKSTLNKAGVIVGIGKSKTFTEIAGPAAPIRLRPDSKQVFVLETGFPVPDRLDTSSVYATLVRLDVNRKAGTRELLFASYGGAYGIGKSRTAEGVIPLNFSRFAGRSISIEPRSILPPGEYAFNAQTAPDPYAPQNQSLYYCFGVD